MAAREPIWDGKRDPLRDRGPRQQRAVPSRAGRRGKPEPVLGGNIRARRVRPRGAASVCTSHDTDVAARDLLRRQAAHGLRRDFAEGRDPRRAGTLHRDLEGRLRGRGVDHASGRLRQAKSTRSCSTSTVVPFTQYGNSFFDEFQVYAAAGYVVALLEPAWVVRVLARRGVPRSTARASGGTGWGTVDYEDLMAVVDTALEKYDFCDPKRLGVMGGSYGGYMTSWIVVAHGPLQGGVLGASGERVAFDERIVRHRLGVRGAVRRRWSTTRRWAASRRSPTLRTSRRRC